MAKKINLKKYTDFIMDKTVELLAIDSPTGYTDEAAAWVKKEFEALGFKAQITGKGGVIVDLGGRIKRMVFLLRLIQIHLEEWYLLLNLQEDLWLHHLVA